MGNSFIYPVPKSTYEYEKNDLTLIFVPSKTTTTNSEPTSPITDGKISGKIPCRYIPCQTRISPFLFVFFHGNSEDIGLDLSVFLSGLSVRFAVNVLCPEYPDYGIYKRKDSSQRMDENILNDARQVLTYCHTQMRFKYENIILIGRSLGSAVTVRLASEFPVKGAILISPFSSIRDVAKHLVGTILSKVVPDILRSIDYVDKLKCPILFIHGRRDTLVPPEMSEEMYEKVEQPKTLIIHNEMTHNEFRVEQHVFREIQYFLEDKLGFRADMMSQRKEKKKKKLQSISKVATRETSSEEEVKEKEVIEIKI